MPNPFNQSDYEEQTRERLNIMSNTALQTTNENHHIQQTNVDFNAFGNVAHFEVAQRMAKALCSSSIVPETYRGEQNIGNAMIALEMANRIGANVMSVLQNLYIVHGRPAWSSQFLISCVNASRKFTPLRYRMTGNKNDDTFGCVAWAQDKTGEKLESPEITVGIAKAEGWYQKNGSKWKTMPELMLRYRTATLFARLYAPELTMGISTEEEVVDIKVVDVSPVVTESTVKQPVFNQIEAPIAARKPRQPKAAEVVVAPLVEVEETLVAVPNETKASPMVEQSIESLLSESPAVSESENRLRAAIAVAGITVKNVLAFCVANKINTAEGNAPESLSQLATIKMDNLTKNISNPASPILAKIKEMA